MTKEISRDEKLIVRKQFHFPLIFVVLFLNNWFFKRFQTLRPWTKPFSYVSYDFLYRRHDL